MERRLVLVLLAMAWTVVAGSALAADPSEIALLIEKGKFQPDEIKVKANAPFILVITNKGDKAAEFESRTSAPRKWYRPARRSRFASARSSPERIRSSMTSTNRPPAE